jgi:hypothetical protein
MTLIVLDNSPDSSGGEVGKIGEGLSAGFETGRRNRTRQGTAFFTLWRPLPGPAPLTG